MRDVRLSASEIKYLCKADFLPRDVKEKIQTCDSEGRTFAVEEELAEECRSTFTQRLAEVGFDLNYEPTEEGRLLESLIDKFASF
jgi:hypothetical protein